jgi:phage-related protein
VSDPDMPLEFIGSSEDDLFEFPTEVKRVIGFALRAAQKGGKQPDAKPLSGFGGASVLEVISDFNGDTFRAADTIKFKGVIYVLHIFQKNSKRGSRRHRQKLTRSNHA